MLPSPGSSPRVILEDRLNLHITPPKKRKFHLPTPPKEAPVSRKRPAKQHAQESGRKKVKVCDSVGEDIEDESEEEDPSLFEESDEDETIKPEATRARRRTVFDARTIFVSTSAHTYRALDGMFSISSNTRGSDSIP